MNYEFQEGDLSIIIGFPFAGERLDLRGRLEPTFIQPFEPGTGYFELQIAGVICLHIDVFGVSIPLPLEDGLADLCRKHLDAGIQGLYRPFIRLHSMFWKNTLRIFASLIFQWMPSIITSWQKPVYP